MPRVYANIEIPRVRRSLGCSPILGTCPLLEHALLSYWDRHALVTCLLKLLGRARFCDMPFNILGTSPLWRHSKFLGQDRSWYMPFNILETSPLWRHALQNSWDMPALGTCPLKCLGHARSWDMPFHDVTVGFAEYRAKRYLELLALPST